MPGKKIRAAHRRPSAKKGTEKKVARKVDLAGPKNSRDRTVQSSARTGSFSAAEARKSIESYLRKQAS